MSSVQRRIFILDDDVSVRKALGRLLASHSFATEEFGSAADFLARKPETTPSCLISDIKMPGLNGLDLQEELVRRNCIIPIIFITGHGDIPMSVKAMKKGAVDFLTKPFCEAELMRAVNSAFGKCIAIINARERSAKIKNLFKKLTAREYEVMRWVITGALNKQIARKLGTTEKTIKVHRGRVMEKLNIDSVADLVRLTQKAGISPAS